MLNVCPKNEITGKWLKNNIFLLYTSVQAIFKKLYI